MALVSPGVEVQVIDESFYTPSGAGTVPMIFVASAENKVSGSGSGIAQGTLKTNAGRPYLLTSQRELGELFGDPTFYTDVNNNPIHGSELNEYGLQTAYSLLGVTNRVWVVRADFDTAKLQPSAVAPGGEPVNNSYWFDTQVSDFGLLEWNSAPATVRGGQSFSVVFPVVITETSDIDNNTDAPKESIGVVGDYAVDATTTMNRIWYKNTSGVWVELGSNAWKQSWATVTGSKANPVLTVNQVITINTVSVNIASGTTVAALANVINTLAIPGVTAASVDGSLELYVNSSSASNGSTADGKISITSASGTLLADLGITAGTYAAPELAIRPHTQVPEFKAIDAEPKPTGSVWFKTTSPNGGADLRVKRYNSDTQLWEGIDAPLYSTPAVALFNLDRAGGGLNLPVGTLYAKTNVDEETPTIGNFKLYRRAVQGETVVKSAKVVTGTLSAASNVEFTISETTLNSQTMSNAVTVAFLSNGSTGDAENLVAAINSKKLQNVYAVVTSQNEVEIRHRRGGEIKIVDTDGSLGEMGFRSYDPTDATTTVNLYYAPGTDNGTIPAQFVATNWRVLSYTASENEPTTLAVDGEIWYNSIVDDVDILYHDGNDWVGYRTSTALPNTDPNGPQVGASAPTTQLDGTPLVEGDLWIDTADIDNYPMIYRWNASIVKWAAVDKTDQTTENGVVFGDARWSDAGSNAEAAPIEDLLLSNYKDVDAPDPNLYPKGMLLWNLRRSGFNVKRFVRNYIDRDADNIRFMVDNLGEYDIVDGEDQSMDGYYPHRWVTESGNNQDGSGTFGRHAQRKTVVQALQAMVNSNEEIRDEDTRLFTLIACPGYPELIGEMITLNYDRRLSAFVVGDTPARLTPDATSLNEWASNVRRAVEDNDVGAVSFDEYLGMYYPWGFTSDNAGNNVVVPPSHMALRTLVLNDQVAYPWFAPAGTRRGGVTNATSSGYISSEGEFISVALNTGQRDVLYQNNINPITFLNGSGLVVFGQKTRARNASALDRINVARLVVYMRGRLEQLVRPYLFEPNDQTTRDQITLSTEAFLLELVSLRALYDYAVVCDDTNNTPARIDRNELWLDIAIEPVKAIEFIYIPLRIKNTGEIEALG